MWHVLFENPDSLANVKLESTHKGLSDISFLGDKKGRYFRSVYLTSVFDVV